MNLYEDLKKSRAAALSKDDDEKKRWLAPVSIQLSYFELLCVTANIELALKHPENSGTSSTVTRMLLKKFIALLHDKFKNDLPQPLIAEWKEKNLI